ncbi:MAG: hypothetical protein WD076_04505, partial [Parvularculaceae bacterium]
SYQPLAEVFAAILPREKRHAGLGEEGLAKIAHGGRKAIEEISRSVDYWRPRVAATFGGAASARYDLLKKFGLRHSPNEVLRREWSATVEAALSRILRGGSA